MRKFFLVSLAVLLASPTPAAETALKTVAEATDYRATSRFADVVDFCNALGKQAPLVRHDILGVSGEGRKLPMLILADPPVATPAEAAKSGKPVVLVIGNIHAGEVDAKEALLMLARDLALGDGRPILQKVIVVICPIFNADGNERIDRAHRTEQMGPADGVGVRENASGYDLNRDFVKLETPEVSSLVRAFNAWDPLLFIDGHTTNGSYHRYPLTYDGQRHPSAPATLVEAVRDRLMPDAGARLTKATGFPTFFYGNFANDHKQWEMYPAELRYSTQYYGLRNRLAVLSESYSYASFHDRVKASYGFIRGCIEHVAEHGAELQKLIADVKPPEKLTLRTKMTQLGTTWKVLGYDEDRRDSKRGLPTVPKDYTLQVLGKVEPRYEVTRPYAYLVPNTFTKALATLERHGIVAEALTRDVELPIEVYRIDKVKRAERPFQRHHTVSVEATARSLTRSIPKGTLVVRTEQKFGTLAGLLLEPECEDGLTTWNFFDEGLEPGKDFAVMRLPKSADLPTTPAKITSTAAPDIKLGQALRWRMIGPFRGGRTVGATGVPGHPGLFYIGVNNGGVWKTNDYGRVWKPIFDDQPTGSIGALAVAPSDPNVIYVGSGEGLQRPDLSVGDGMYKSIDAGKTWKHIGLAEGQQISAILIDPKDANRVFVSVLGHPYGANPERGVFRTKDGGATWDKVLYKDENTGAMALAFDPSNPQTIYVDLWAARQGPWENGQWQGPNSGLYKSTDGGTTWNQLTKGLPTPAQGLGRIGFCVAPSDPNRMYATVDAGALGGIYRSDDAGASWRRMSDEARLWGRGSDFAEIKADPKNKDVIWIANTSFYKSSDGGKTYSCIKGAPGGDDYHTVWIDPDRTDVILLAGDQGAVVTVNGGETWSSWYNQPTAQFYHVSTDNQFPYWVYSGQQESGSAGVSSRGRDGHITFRDWYPVGAEEYGYVAPDPLDANIIYGGKVQRFDRRTGQVQEVAPDAIRSGKYRFLRTAPLLFSTVDPHQLFLAGNVVFKTNNGGKHWDVISPDLSREKPEVPASIGVYRTPELANQPRRGVVYTVAPSYKDINTIWAGTDDGLIHVTRDGGKTWRNVTPPGLTAWSKVSLIDAGRFDAATAFAAVNRIRLDDMKPHIYRTHDGGTTWQEIVTGLPTGPINAVREDPVRPGLLYCGSETAVHVSLDDGQSWRPLRLNMPATSIRDLVVHGDDLVVGTHGRSFWILDDVTPIRQLDQRLERGGSYLFAPQLAHRVRWNVNTDTPLPPEEPVGENPPDGALLHYYLKEAQGPVTLEILDPAGKLVRRFASDDPVEVVDPKSLVIAAEWVRPEQRLSPSAGLHRFVWDLHYPPPAGAGKNYPIAAVYHNTVAQPQGSWVLPGVYTVKLTVGGHSQTQPLTVKMDPRVSITQAALEHHFTLAKSCYDGAAAAHAAQKELQVLRAQIKKLLNNVGQNQERAEKLGALDTKLGLLEGASRPGRGMGPPGPGRRPRGEQPTFGQVHGQLIALLELINGCDAAPTEQAETAYRETTAQLATLMKNWQGLKASAAEFVKGE